MTLLTDELFWRDRYTFFLNRGYKLRPRYHPDWVPSWEGKDDVILSFCEDRIAQLKSNLLDATHVDSGKPVFIKRVESNYYPDEVKIAMYLSSIKDARNHCAKVLELFRDEQDASVDYIVMPGLEFMHERGVAHRDCASRNILMCSDELFRDGWHPMHHYKARDGRHLPVQSLRRSEAEITYYFIDFGLSSMFEPGQEPLVTGVNGRVALPERSNHEAYDAFKGDVYILGSVFREHILEKFADVQFLELLVNQMAAQSPLERPSASIALQIWNQIRDLLPSTLMDQRLRSRNESMAESWFRHALGSADSRLPISGL
ncbi:hypothetical protein HYDPIDRAFT_171871 [Hydnomerulius pinastri MD-312]|nr:hypothetical protein HYDPIDRAFT_171871 [Hydnomerulius pinastri MD-312]